MGDVMKIDKLETNKTVVNKADRVHLNCAFCPPNQGENASGKRIPRTDKYKSKRKGKA